MYIYIYICRKCKGNGTDNYMLTFTVIYIY